MSVSRRSVCQASRSFFVHNSVTESLEPRTLLAGTVLATVAHDANNNGSLNSTDPRLSGWTVYVDYNRNAFKDDGEPFAITNSSGQAQIDGVPDDTWDFREIVPTGFAPADGFEDVERTRVRDGRTTNVTFLNVPVASGGTITGTIWNDVNRDGIRDAADPGVPGWTVFLDLNDDRFPGEGEPTTVTDGSGRYTFTNLSPRRYRVREVTPNGWDPTVGFDGGANVDVAAGQTRTADFGNFNVNGFGTIRGTVWNDVNADGFRAAGDPGVGDWQVFLDLNLSGTPDAGEPTTLTDAGGNYTFASIAAGTYRVTQVLKSGWNASPGRPVAVDAIANNEDPGVADFGVYTPVLGSISGRVYNDADGNGVRGAGEVGLGGVTVFIDGDNNGALDPGEASDVTAADGTYTLSGVPIGSFNVRELVPNGTTPTAPGTGVQLVRVLNGASVTNIDFGNKQRTDGTISGVAFADTDPDGKRSPTEKGLAGLLVYLDLDNDGTRDAAEPSTVTSQDLFYTPGVDETGAYSFTHLAAGTYVVRQIVPDLLSGTPAAVLAKTVALSVGEQRTNVNFADRYRANEIRGVIFDDTNRNGVRDPGEAGLAGVTVYLDLDRDNKADHGEPRTVTAVDGSYLFTTGLAPGAYVVRALHHSGRHHSSPTTTGGILWPSGVSNPSIGNVTPGSITTSLANGQTDLRTVSLTLPNAGAITDKVDVFLLFDDTGSFTSNSPIVREAFPQLIATLQAAMPTVDFGFGVGRFEEYANFASENSTGRPFILNQPILAASTPGFATSIQAALDRTAPGYGGDTSETDIEALFQAATGRGFDGNNNGTTTDSGAAGLVGTQLTPGDSGDVPAFGSFTVDASGNVLPPSGNIGGAGFRPGALPIILTATDTGFAFQPRGETSITGVGGLTLPLSAFTQTSRPTTPFDSGAGVQETVTALNAVGALVIGLGTNGAAAVDPRQGLEALAKLTGAVNRSANTIANGTTDPIGPGDPLYFQISSGFAASVSNGIVSAIENAVSNVAVDLTLRATDSRVKLASTPGVVRNVAAGQTATFDVTFTGDGRPHRFDLQFVRDGTNVVLGSIPVVIGTPIDGDGYEYVEIEDGEHHHGDDFGDWYDDSMPLNTAPSFVKGADQVADGDGNARTIADWATALSAGAANDADQVLDFALTTDNDALFSVLPAVDDLGTLTFTPAAGASGVAIISVRVRDSGGTVGGGQDTSATQTFRIQIGDPVLPLAITGVFEFQTRQALTFDFDRDVSADLGKLTVSVIDIATGNAVAVQPMTYDAAARRLTVLFADRFLADGSYRAFLSAAGLAMLPSPYQKDFFVLAGDIDRDGGVSINDFNLFAANFGKGTGQTWLTGDFDYDGGVSIDDFNKLTANFGKTITTPAVPQARRGVAPAKR